VADKPGLTLPEAIPEGDVAITPDWAIGGWESPGSTPRSLAADESPVDNGLSVATRSMLRSSDPN
jgi:hypothetical protein